MELSKEEKNILFRLARESIEIRLVKKQKPIKVNTSKYPILNSHSGIFVTLTINGSLRGCIGYITTDEPLYKTVKDAASNAAFEDPRFSPLSKEEYEKVEVEISILSEPYPMKNYDEIEVGTHGLILEEAGRRGLLLPQVPIEHNMNKEEYLDAICRKSGLPAGSWRERKLNMYLFTASVFSENELEGSNGSG